jgi:nucleotide-binding universal stress UspA family protein
MGDIVVGVDGSAESFAAADWAAAEAERHGSALVVVHGFGLGRIAKYLLGDAIGAAYEDEVRKEEAEELVEHVAQRARDAHPGLAVRGVVVPAKGAEAVADAAHGADMLVVGTSGSGARVARSLGSVAAELPTRCACPVVIVPSPA